jgi:peptidoglycan/LPS O-acetylase OafA/YrhL
MYYRWGFCLALGLLIPWFQEMRLGPFNRLAHILAKYSYGIYLAHPALLGAFLLPAPLPVQLLVLAIGMFTVPVILFHTIEQPMINFGRKIATRRSAVRPVPAAVAAGADQPLPAASLR